MNRTSQNKKNDLKVFIANRDSKCGECERQLGRHAWIMLDEDKGALCLSCADLDHLVFLPSGDAALTRRSKKYSRLHAVVLKWSRARKRYERQGLLVENEAVEKAEEECEADAEQREFRRARALLRREELDQGYIKRFAEQVRELYPGCPTGREHRIAQHACRKYSGRVGRSAAAKELDEDAITLAVLAHIRHTETDYDEMLLRGIDRFDARQQIKSAVNSVIRSWRQG